MIVYKCDACGKRMNKTESYGRVVDGNTETWSDQPLAHHDEKTDIMLAVYVVTPKTVCGECALKALKNTWDDLHVEPETPELGVGS